MTEFTFERMYIPSCEQSNAINAAAEPGLTRDSMAGFYADCIRAHAIAHRNGREGVDFRAVNAAILARWPKGLTYIKEKAWRKVEKNEP